MALTHLADTSVLTRIAKPPVRAVVAPLLLVAALARTSISDLEIGYSARNGAEWDRLAGALNALPLIDVDEHHFRRARQVQRLLADQGLKGRKVPDLLVAAAAEQRGLTVLHYDADFDHIADVTGQPTQWVVPPGHID